MTNEEVIARGGGNFSMTRFLEKVEENYDKEKDEQMTRPLETGGLWKLKEMIENDCICRNK